MLRVVHRLVQQAERFLMQDIGDVDCPGSCEDSSLLRWKLLFR